MDLLTFARGPALWFSLAAFAVGTLWRVGSAYRHPSMRDHAPARAGTPPAWVGALHAILRGMWPRHEFSPAIRFAAINGYVFHIGLAVVFFGYAPHIAFVRRLTGLSWPALPDFVMYVAAGATIVSLLVALAVRVADPVRRLLSNADDAISWTVTFLPMITGMAVVSEPSAASLARGDVLYRGPLAIHLLSLELLLIWFPFGKLMHAVLFAFSRGATGIRFNRRGVVL